MPLPLHVPSPLSWFRFRFRRGAAIAVAAAAAFGTDLAPAFARNEPPDDGDDAVEIVGWDLADPVNHAESRAFFAGLWAAEDAGLPPPAFEFTNTPPGLMLAMLLPELEVFTEIYGHRLQLDFDAGERYLVTDLIADDAEVRAGFRAFVLTGKLAPRPEVDADAYLSHLDLVVDAMTVQQRASIESVESLGMLVESEGLSVEAAPGVDADMPVGPDQTTPTAQEISCKLRWLVEWSRLKCMYGRLYERDKAWPDPDFDCDDFADVMLRYLLRHLDGWTGKVGVSVWRCADDTTDGHAVPVLIDPNGAYWWIEPRTGKVYGPFTTLSGLLANMRAEHPRARNCGTDDIHDHLRDLGPWNLSGWCNEQDPWHQSVRQRNRFCDALAACCRDVVSISPLCPPPSGVPSGPLANCKFDDYLPPDLPPTLPPLPDNAWPAPCNPAPR